MEGHSILNVRVPVLWEGSMIKAKEVSLSKFVGAMVGTALGDAIGERAFHRDILKLTPDADKRTLTYTDDTAMAIGLAESLVACGGINEKHLGDTFKKNWSREPWRGYAGGPPTIFQEVAYSGRSYRSVAERLYGGRGSLGNGAAMRVAPVALLYYDAETLYEEAEASSVVTHTHPVGIDGAAVLAKAIAFAVIQDITQGPFPSGKLVSELASFARTSEIREKIEKIAQCLEAGMSPQASADALGRGVEAHLSVPFALYSFMKHPSSFKDCLTCASENGGDRDTLGAMACAISGAYLGVEAIPKEWRARLENKAYIEKLAAGLWQTRKGVRAQAF
jgi:poly(ADP-ribose) glycohydrolase ARH3